MKTLLFFLLLSVIGFAQTRDDILNNLQRGGILDITDASPSTSYDVLTWDGDELKLVTIQVLGQTFDALNTNTISLDSSVSVGTNVFTTTAAADTVVISGTTTDDVFLVSPIYVAGVDQQDVLEVTVKADTLIVSRLASGESALKYAWVRFKTH